jgi:hypothetical protein
MSKIGLITYHNSVNYGAVLQAYALQKFLRSEGHNVEFIDYQPKQITTSNTKYLYFRGQRLINPALVISGLQKREKFSSFMSSKLPLSRKTFYTKEELKTSLHNYNVVICGSDEVWNVSDAYTDFGQDLSYFLDFINDSGIRKVSYATSFGYTTEIKQSSQANLSRLLNDFEHIGVRDSNSLGLVEQCGAKATKVLDPTFLVNYSDILCLPKNSEKYILLYGSFSRVQGKCIENLAQSEGLDIISIGARPGEWKPKKSVINIGPKEWVGYFANATYVFTNYFHGAIFSIIFKKPFTSFDRSGKSIKVKDLLNSLGLADRIVTADQISALGNDLPSSINWNEEKLDRLVEYSKNYLTNALSGLKQS